MKPCNRCIFVLLNSLKESLLFQEKDGGGGGGSQFDSSHLFNKKDSLRMKNELAPLSTEVTQRRTELVSIQSDIQVIDVYINQ